MCTGKQKPFFKYLFRIYLLLKNPQNVWYKTLENNRNKQKTEQIKKITLTLVVDVTPFRFSTIDHWSFITAVNVFGLFALNFVRPQI